MTQHRFTELSDRRLLRVGGEDAAKFLQGLITCDVEHLAPGEIAFGALLSPQGKILFDFFVVASTQGFILDVAAELADDLAKRLTFYKLRAKVEIGPMDERTQVFAVTGENIDPAKIVADGIIATDPRHKDMGARAYLRRLPEGAQTASLEEWNAMRINLGMPKGGSDFAFGDAFPHEALMDQFKGVDFAKGCYVGQEVVSRMQHRGTARKRVIKVSGDAALPASGCEIIVAGKTCGELGSTAGKEGLAMVRLDRAASHINGEPAFAGTQPVTLSIPLWCLFAWPSEE